MNLEEYRKLPKLRIVVTKEIEKILKEEKVLSIESINPHNRWRYHKGKRALPITHLYGNKSAFKKVISQKPIFLTHGGIRTNLPGKISEDLSYLTGLICGDGNLFISKKRDYIVSISNKEVALLEEASKILKENFSYDAGIKKGHKCLTLEVRSEVIHSFFNKIMQIETGTKKDIKIPESVKLDRKLVLAFIAGFFDAEGSVALKNNRITCQISISQKQKAILEEIDEELLKNDIPMKAIFKQTNYGREYWTLYGNKASLAPFLEKVHFVHPKKRENLETAVKNQAIMKNPKASFDSEKNQAACFLTSKNVLELSTCPLST